MFPSPSFTTATTLFLLSATPSLGISPPVPRSTPKERVWGGMVHNFGHRWEGRTYKYCSDVRVVSDELASVYQLEFPEEGRTGCGTWRGWNVATEGDTRVLPLSLETCIDRSAGYSTFQFERGKVGGRCPVELCGGGTTIGAPSSSSSSSDGEGVSKMKFVEINFFHGRLRRGVVVSYALDLEKKCYRRNSRVLVMNFRRSSKGYGSTGEMEEESVAIPCVQTAAVEGDDFFAAVETKCRFDVSVEDYLEREISIEEVNPVEEDEEGCGVTFYPEGLFVCLPDSIALDDGVSQPGLELQFGCDFRRDGGPIKLLRVKYGENKQLVGWNLDKLK